MLQRPYAIATPGIPVQTKFDMFNLSYTYKFRNPSNDCRAPTLDVTEIYLPARRYAQALKGGAVQLQISDGEWRYEESVCRQDLQKPFRRSADFDLTETSPVLDAYKQGSRSTTYA